ncbi:enoyl-CoA hydratase domain-containing protein 3, mitochondrial [Bufo bufo]|uniref:enoyl-CoA hydratase domain-containing protein 3, mitochondrial n=1 Tax=Bufo bufo TaxID=8384 RepID=UPI001ABDD76B|nr:enoyl-CoA hydratase domain-containing protein 3, mitochondrial [Bufo bufo]
MYSRVRAAAVRAPGLAVTALRRWQTGTGQQEAPLTDYVQEAGIRKITMNNPQKRNALSLAMLQSLQKDILHEVDDNDLRVIVIAANGPVFSSGHNLKEFTADLGKAYHADVFNACVKLMTTIQTIPVPVIAQVNGLATAAGCQLVASCDIAVASEKSKFATPGVHVGLFCSTPAVALARAVPRKVALEMLFTGEPISAHDALLHGLVSKVVPEENLEAETMKIALKICQASRTVIALGKATFYKQISQGLEEAYRLTSQVMLQNLMLKDGQEGIEAFTQKRKPVWTNSQE